MAERAEAEALERDPADQDPQDQGENEGAPTEGAEGEAHEGEGAADPPAEGAAEGDPEPKSKPVAPWLKKRIDRATREKEDAKRERDAEKARADAAVEHAKRLRALLEADGKEVPDDAPPAERKATTAADIEREASRIADERLNADRVAQESARVMNAGKAAFKDWEDTRREFVDNFGEELQAKPEFFDALFALENGHEVFHALGRDPDEAARVLAMSPQRMGIELAKLSAKKPAGKAASSAPPPIRPLNGTANPPSANALADDDDMDAFIRKREGKSWDSRRRN